MNLNQYAPTYHKSHAIVIGVNNYSSAPPLRYASNDAKAIADLLRNTYSFEESRITLLLDIDATRSNLIDAFMALASDGTEINDRVVFYFAGHGHTVRTKRGDIGYLVPHDGNPKSLGSLIRWDEFTRNADLIEAKHLLFLMDSCYGGLAIMRTMNPGSSRFLKDMLLRPARQVLTAGKADEQVADLGGPIPEHSVFTGHLLQALSGKAADAQGFTTANGVMAYVYQLVAHDPDSHQTPHFGYLHGDGDLIFSADKLKSNPDELTKNEDVLLSVPAIYSNQEVVKPMNLIAHTKELLGDGKHRILLHDLVVSKTRELLSLTAENSFPVTGAWSPEEMGKRMTSYEETTQDLRTIEALISHWGTEAHAEILSLPLRRLCCRQPSGSGIRGWLSLRWYPAFLLLYSSGIAAIAAKNYRSLFTLLNTPIIDPDNSTKQQTVTVAVDTGLRDITESFKKLPGHERLFVPRSEYLFRILQPSLEDLFFLGEEYETNFDSFEVLFALEHAHQFHRFWGPVGRFGYKYDRGGNYSPFHRVLDEATKEGKSWAPLKAGLFGGTLDRFNEVAHAFDENILSKLFWH